MYRDKKYRKETKRLMAEYNKNVKAQEKRRLQEEKLKGQRIKHPKVKYLDDYRPISPKQVI